MKKNLPCLLLFVVMSVSLHAQDNDVSKEQAGALSGQWRTFYMSTHNKGELRDFYSLATGGKIQYIQPIGKHFKIGGAVYTSYNFGIQDLTIADATTGGRTRYEGALYDVRDLDDPFLILLGEAYLQVYGEKHDLKIGRMKLNTPLINPTDGWMLPTLEQGIWYEYAPNSSYTIRTGIITATARGTDKFYGIGDAIGNFGTGRNLDGSPSGYAGNTHSDFVAIGNLDWSPTEQIKVEFWNFLIDNVSNTVLIKPSVALDDEGTKLAFEWYHQDKVGNGGNSDISKSYFQDEYANVIGTQIEWKAGLSKLMIGYDHIFKGGRFLFPREWGRETFFTFQRRERAEGSTNNHALVLTHERTLVWKENALRTVMNLGHQWKPDISNVSDNKYDIPNYTHVMVDLFYSSEKLKNLKPEFLFVYKFTGRDYTDSPGVIFNKVDMYQLNFIVNYNF